MSRLLIKRETYVTLIPKFEGDLNVIFQRNLFQKRFQFLTLLYTLRFARWYCAKPPHKNFIRTTNLLKPSRSQLITRFQKKRPWKTRISECSGISSVRTYPLHPSNLNLYVLQRLKQHEHNTHIAYRSSSISHAQAHAFTKFFPRHGVGLDGAARRCYCGC